MTVTGVYVRVLFLEWYSVCLSLHLCKLIMSVLMPWSNIDNWGYWEWRLMSICFHVYACYSLYVLVHVCFCVYVDESVCIKAVRLIRGVVTKVTVGWRSMRVKPQRKAWWLFVQVTGWKMEQKMNRLRLHCCHSLRNSVLQKVCGSKSFIKNICLGKELMNIQPFFLT